MTYPEYIFVTGVPGSRWTSFTETLADTGLFNMTDRNEHRQYYHHGRVRHQGSFFGVGMEFPAQLDKDNLDAPFTDKGGTKFICSHEWALMLPEIKWKYPDAWIMMIYRPSMNALQWWSEAGGFGGTDKSDGIKYPNYGWYQDPDTMYRKIIKQNQMILEFGKQNQAQWVHTGKDFYKKFFDKDLTPSKNQTSQSDILATVIK